MAQADTNDSKTLESEDIKTEETETEQDRQKRFALSEHTMKSAPSTFTGKKIASPVMLKSSAKVAASNKEFETGFVVSIVTGKDAASSSIKVTGSNVSIVNNASFSNLFKNSSLNDSSSKGRATGKVYDYVSKYFGKKPNDVFARSTTPWGDLYKTYDWSQLKSTVYVSSAKVTEITAEPANVANKVFTNTSSKTGTFSGGVSTSVQESHSHTTSHSNTIGLEVAVESEAKFLGLFGAKSTYKASYSHTWGTSDTNTKTVTLGSTDNVSVVLEPGESVTASLNVSKGTLKYEVEYTQKISGSLAVNYSKKYKGHHFWSLNSASVLQAANLPTTFTWVEKNEVGFYTDSEVVLSDVTKS